ncbi:MAG: hypothetical protein UU23_C0002G0036 [Candidatus Curtissbacteria bacterium GW2011_GWA1_40_9]|uniref:Uncharacterized protein n=1 Tax=Candidatus Curtissbacteria bacterium GW2011_GWA1_40_9 TaxID=1618408 RepID=A0A0G0TMG2_9BACT|nr:MAG: hypothetical protein UU23_C0002G0036 [Candidatus Curtissbacteria bacterium GW2011_GWA1_40_9]
MKQISINEVIDAFGEEPVSIGDRLKALGFDDEDTAGFSEELLGTQVYASSFVKFLQDNREKLSVSFKIPAKQVPHDFINPFGEGEETLERRLIAIGFSVDDFGGVFERDVLDLEVTGDEFQQFLEANKEKILGKIDHMASMGGANA